MRVKPFIISVVTDIDFDCDSSYPVSIPFMESTMKLKVNMSIIILFLIISPAVFSQSAYLDDGVGGSGFFVNGVIDDSGFSTIGIISSYSIGGIMDFGIDLKTEQGTIDNNDSTDLNLSLLYNLIAIKQSVSQPINVQLEGSYGYINTTSDYLDYYNRRRTGQGFNLGIFLYHNFFSSSIVGFNLGGKLQYSNFLTTTYDYTDPNIPEIVSEARTENIKYGGAVSFKFHPELWPLFNIGLSVFYDPNSEIVEYLPSINIIAPQY